MVKAWGSRIGGASDELILGLLDVYLASFKADVRHATERFVRGSMIEVWPCSGGREGDSKLRSTRR